MVTQRRRRLVELDEAVSSVGGFGLFQKVMMFLLCPAAMFQGARMTANVFLLFQQDYRCKIPEDTNDTAFEVNGLYQQVWYNMSIPVGSSCTVYDPNQNYEYDQYNRPVNGSTVQCPQGYVYDTSEMEITAVEEMNMVCGDDFYVAHTNMLLYLGSLVGSTVLGFVADNFGRKKCFLLCVVLYLASGIAMSWSPNFAALAIFQFLSGAASTGFSANAFVMALEFVEPKHRKVPALFYMASFSLGEMITGGVAYGLKNWKWINLVITVPAVWFITYIWLLPESIRWLMVHKKWDEVAKILDRASRWNKRPLPAQAANSEEMAGLLESFKAEATSEDGEFITVIKKPTDSFWHMFSSKVLAFRVSIIFINWLLIMTIFYGFVFNSDNLVSGNVFMNFVLGAVVELPAHFTTLCLIDKIGRKAMHCAFLLLALLASGTAIGVVFQEHQWVVLMLSCIGKFGAAGLTGTSFLWTIELFPTSTRSTGLGISNSFGRVGALITSSYIIHQTRQMHSQIGQAIPFIIFCLASFVTMLLVLLLPETLKKKLPDNIEEAKMFGREEEDFPPALDVARPSVYGTQGDTCQGS